MDHSEHNATPKAASPDELKDLYRQLILDHARTPKNFQRLDAATHTAEGINPLCGDKIQLYLVVDDDGQITKVGFEGSGCAISIASSSLMTQTVESLTVQDAEKVFATVTHRLAGRSTGSKSDLPLSSNIRALDGVRKYPSRVKCATLAWHTLHAALNSSTSSATTE